MGKKGLLNDIETHKEYTLPIILVGIFLIVVSNVGIDYLTEILDFNLVMQDFAILGEDFVNTLGAISIFLYGFVPSAFRIIGTTGFFLALIADGVNPFILIILGAVGEAIGSSVLYLVGRLLFKHLQNKGIDRKMASTDHLLAKYRIFVYFSIAFIGTAGDIIMLVSGHQRIGLLKIFPFLVLGNFFKYAIWLMITIEQLNLG